MKNSTASKTFTTAQIAEFLSKDFRGVSPLTEITPELLSGATESRTVNIRHFEGLQIEIVVYTYNTAQEIENDEDCVIWNRAAFMPTLNKAYHF